MSLLPSNFLPDTFGANLIGTMLSCMSFGILLAVAWTYFSRLPKDRWAYKILATLMVIISTTDTVINCNYTYKALILNYNSELFILLENWNFQTNIILIGLACVALQGFMSYRIWIVTERRWRLYPAFSVALSVAALVIAIWLATWYGKQSLTTALATKPALVWSWFGSATLSEVMSTCALNWFLILKPRKDTGPAHVVLPTQNIFKRLALRAVETNLVSLAVHLSVVMLYAKHDAVYFWYSAPAFTLVKVYSISLLVTLNSRASEAHSLSRDGSSPGSAALRPDFLKFSSNGSRAGTGGGGRNHQVQSGGVTFDFEWHVHVSERGPHEQDEFPVYTPHFSFGPTPALFPLAAGAQAGTESGSTAGGHGLGRSGSSGELKKGSIGVAIGSPGEEEEHELVRFESDKAKANMGWI